jgi:hypothetical protein
MPLPVLNAEAICKQAIVSVGALEPMVEPHQVRGCQSRAGSRPVAEATASGVS